MTSYNVDKIFHDVTPFSTDDVRMVEFSGGTCRIFQENGYHCRIPLPLIADLMGNMRFAKTVKFVADGLVEPEWFAKVDFWERALLNTSKIFVHGLWHVDSLSMLFKCCSKLVKICITYWHSTAIIPHILILQQTKCRDFVIDLRGIGTTPSFTNSFSGDTSSLGSNVKALEIVRVLPLQMTSVVLIFEEYFQVDFFREIQKIITTKMVSGSQAVLLFNGEVDCIEREFMKNGGRLRGFAFSKAQSLHIASYSPKLFYTRETKNMDAFNIYYKTYRDISFVVGARIKVLKSKPIFCNSNIEYDVPCVIDAVPCSLNYALDQHHIEFPKTGPNPATGRDEIPQDEIAYESPHGKPCCQIYSVAETYKNLKGHRFAYGVPSFRRNQFLSVLHEKVQYLKDDVESVTDIVYFPKHVELHLDNGLITRPDVDEIFILHLFKASKEHLTVFSTSADRRAIEGLSLGDHLENAQSIEFGGRWWGRMIYQFVKRRSAELKRFTCFCFQGQRTGLSNLWQHFKEPEEVYIAPQLTHLTFDARDCKFDNLLDVLRASFDENNKEQMVVDHYQKILLVVSKFSGTDVGETGPLDFEVVIKMLKSFTVIGAEINLAIMNAVPYKERAKHNYVGEKDLLKGSLEMKCIGKTLIPYIHNKCNPNQSDFYLKLYYSNAFERHWRIAIPSDSK